MGSGAEIFDLMISKLFLSTGGNLVLIALRPCICEMYAICFESCESDIVRSYTLR
jgi:hypothetical protein